MSACEVCGRERCEVYEKAQPWPSTADTISHYLLGYSRQRARAEKAEALLREGRAEGAAEERKRWREAVQGLVAEADGLASLTANRGFHARAVAFAAKLRALMAEEPEK